MTQQVLTQHASEPEDVRRRLEKASGAAGKGNTPQAAIQLSPIESGEVGRTQRTWLHAAVKKVGMKLGDGRQTQYMQGRTACPRGARSSAGCSAGRTRCASPHRRVRHSVGGEVCPIAHDLGGLGEGHSAGHHRDLHRQLGAQPPPPLSTSRRRCCAATSHKHTDGCTECR